jgi:hypothetical protein
VRTLEVYNGNLYIVIRKIPIHNFKRKHSDQIVAEAFNGWKEHLEADHVLKTDTHFVFCQVPQDVEWEPVKN